MAGGKINKQVVYTEYLNMRPYMSEPQVTCSSTVMTMQIVHWILLTSLLLPSSVPSSLLLPLLSPLYPPPSSHLLPPSLPLLPFLPLLSPSFPPSLLQGPTEWYQLYGVLVHFGFSCHSGHYYCYIKNSNGIWYCMNDSQVRQHC